MKTLIGKIFRLDDGSEIIEREKPRNRVLWEMERELSCVTDGYRLVLKCPQCGYQLRYKGTLEMMRDLVEGFYTKKTSPSAYCGYCGHQNIIF